MKNELILVTWGGIGDLLVCTPTIKAIREAYPGHKLIVYCSTKAHYDVLQHNPHVDSIRRLHFLHFWRYPLHLMRFLLDRKNFKFYSLEFQHIPLSWIYQKNVKEIVADIFEDLHLHLADKKVQIFLTKKEDKQAVRDLSPFPNPVLIHVHSRSSNNHHWPAEKWERLVKEMPEIAFIQVGHPDEPPVKGALDWRGRHTTRQVLALLKNARSFVGIDSSLAHATNGFGLPGVILFGDSNPATWGHDNNINIYKAVRCSPCYYYVWNHPCPYGHECMESITVEDVKKALLRQLARGYAVHASPGAGQLQKAEPPVRRLYPTKAI